MPLYEYRCDNGHTFEVMQRMSDDPVTTCEVCGAPVQRVFHPVAVHFKGSGFYTTDYGRKKAGSDGGGADSKKDSGDKATTSAKSGSADAGSSSGSGSSGSSSSGSGSGSSSD